MSKHLGNILEPIPLMDEHGADAVRWFMAASGSPWSARRVGHAHHPGDRPQGPADLLEHRRLPRPLRPDGRLDAGLDAGAAAGRAGRCWTAGRSPRRTGWSGRSPRRWRTSTPSAPGTLLAAFVDDLSNWYVRRSRRRFWDGDPAALATLHEALDVAHPADGAAHAVRHRAGLAGHRSRSTSTAARSRCTWPPGRRARRRARRRRARRAGGAGPPAGRARPGRPRRRQGARPASRCAARSIASAASTALADELRAEVADELNVGTLEPSRSAGDLVDFEAKGNFRALGKRFGKQTPVVAAAIAAADAAAPGRRPAPRTAARPCWSTARRSRCSPTR